MKAQTATRPSAALPCNPPHWTESSLLVALLAALACTALSACSTDAKKMFPLNGAEDMRTIYRSEAGSTSNGALADARLVLRRPLNDTGAPTSAVPAALVPLEAQAVKAQFVRLPNPDLLMYVFPHLAGSEGAPVPGYLTVFPLYQSVHYALPGERVEDF